MYLPRRLYYVSGSDSDQVVISWPSYMLHYCCCCCCCWWWWWWWTTTNDN